MISKLTDGPRVNADLSRTGAIVSRGENRKKSLNAAPWSQTWPAPQATLDLDFANDRGYVRGVGQGRSMDAVTFTRASNGNYVKPDGTLSSHANQGALGNNLLTFPQDFDNAAWSKISAGSSVVVANQELSPDKTNSADQLIAANNGLVSGISQAPTTSISAGNTEIFSVYAKKGTSSFVVVRNLRVNNNLANTNSAWFDLINGTVGTTQSALTASIDDVGDGWYRCSISGVTAGSVNRVDIQPADTDGSNNVVNGNFIYIWGAQLEVGSTATEYFPTNINTPRFDWASTAQRPQNLLRYTEEFDNAAWTKTRTEVISGYSDPVGGSNAFLFRETAITGTHIMPQQITTINNNAAITFSIRAQYAGRLLQLAFGTGDVSGDPRANFDLQNGVLGSVSDGISATITDIGSGWCLCSVTAITAVSSAFDVIIALVANTTSPRTSSYAGDGTSGVYIYGAQLEVGDTATTYIANGAYSATNTPLAANPTCNGLLIEEARTNRLLWNRDATDAAWVKTDVTAAKDQTGIDGVANAASSLTSTADNGTCIQTITLGFGSRTGSVFLKRITGTGNVQVSLDGSTWSTVDLSDTEWRRIVLSGTVTNPTVGIRLAVSGDAVAMDYGQIEDGAFATSPILTTTASATRAADATRITGIKFSDWYRPDEGTFIVTATHNNSTDGRLIEVGTSASNLMYGTTRTSTEAFAVVFNFSISANITSTGPAINTKFKRGFVYKLDDFAVCLNAGTIGVDTSGNVALVTPDIQLGYSSFNGSRSINGYLQQIVFYPRKVNANVLQELTKL
jgi:hypothetical protein